jgi:hypothetical protein
VRVGVVADPPWVILGKGEPRGVEPELIRRFAEQVGTEIEWVEGTWVRVWERRKREIERARYWPRAATLTACDVRLVVRSREMPAAWIRTGGRATASRARRTARPGRRPA